MFGIYVAFGLVLPGLLLIRVLYRRRRTLVEELALGLALGYALEVLVYIVARAVGLPLLVLVWPVATYVLFAAVPRLRRRWRGGDRPGTPRWWSWSLALIIGYLIARSGIKFFKGAALTWPALGTAGPDPSFHLAMIGELKHHMPPTMPMVAGEPLFYHWFVYAHLAAASWVTGIEPLVLLFRLGMLPMVIAFVVLVGTTGRRVMGSWAGALLALLGTIFVAIPNLYIGANDSFTWGGVPDLAWTSPTQTFGALLFAAVVLLLIDLLDRRRPTAGRWLLLGILLIAVTGAKASYLPLLIAGLVMLIAVETIRRRPPWLALIVLGMTVACFLYAQFVLFGRVRQGLVVAPFFFMRTAWQELTGLGSEVDPPMASVLGMALVCLLCWAVMWSGALGLLSRPRLLMRPAVVLMLGFGATGIGAALLLGHPGRSQLFFLWGAYPYLAIVAIYGILVLLRRARLSLRGVLPVACAGALAAYLIPILCGVEIPLSPGQADDILYRPYIVLLIVGILVTAVLIATVGRLRTAAFVAVMCAAIGLLADGHAFVLLPGQILAKRGLHEVIQPGTAPEVPQGALTVARWLRAHSEPDDLVATNAHCLWGHENPCDSREFWVAALSERRVLVEGWAFAPTSVDRWSPGQSTQSAVYLPFWDDERITLNEAAFHAPSAASIQRLRERYGVRWLFVDERRTSQGAKIGEFANLRLRSGDYALYQVPEGQVGMA
ncbi:hypothetical protein ACQPYK_33900 [Streptosporangium sp. CA-135522]|uniref:hypothetical protein n=1 Tax=Streptosporangium sp. CA-135522 TaxID=3240072 RepID=UPI003D91F5E8